MSGHRRKRRDSSKNKQQQQHAATSSRRIPSSNMQNVSLETGESSISLSSTRCELLWQEEREQEPPPQEEHQPFDYTYSQQRHPQHHPQHYAETTPRTPTRTNNKGSSNNNNIHNDSIEMDRSLCWRLDPSESLSDWQLQIFNRSTRTFDIYHVHKVLLAVGPRSCGYFQEAFQKQKGLAYNNHATRVPMIAQGCQWVPTLLDFVYDKDSFAITHQNAVALYHLAEFFRNQQLFKQVTAFLNASLSSSKCRASLAIYYVDSFYYDLHDLLSHVLDACSRELLGMVRDGSSYSDLLDEMSPAHFSQVLIQVPETDVDTKNAILLTRLISQYCSMHKAELSMEMFETFTSRIRVLDSSSALSLLEASLDYDFAAYKKRNESQASISSLVFFQRECIGTLSEEWEQLLDIDQERITRIMRTLSLREEHENVLVDWFQKTLIRASSQLSTVRRDKDALQQEYDTLQKDHKLVVEDLEYAHSKYATLQRNYTTTKSEMKTQISSWVRKNEGHTLERQADEEQWKLDRSRWEMERQKWEYEKFEMNQQIHKLQQELRAATPTNREQPTRERTSSGGGGSRKNNRPLPLPNYIDDSLSVASDDADENNSIAADDAIGYATYYPFTNGLHPKFRLF